MKLLWIIAGSLAFIAITLMSIENNRIDSQKDSSKKEPNLVEKKPIIFGTLPKGTMVSNYRMYLNDARDHYLNAEDWKMTSMERKNQIMYAPEDMEIEVLEREGDFTKFKTVEGTSVGWTFTEAVLLKHH